MAAAAVLVSEAADRFGAGEASGIGAGDLGHRRQFNDCLGLCFSTVLLDLPVGTSGVKTEASP